MDQMGNPYDFDVLVIGGGHAGSEAALAGGPLRGKTALLDQQPRHHRPDELQSGHRRRGQGADRPRNRRPGRRDGPGHRRHRHPVPHAQPQQGAGHARPARPGRQAGLSAAKSNASSKRSRACACGRKRSRTCWSKAQRRRIAARSSASASPTARSIAPRAVVLCAGTFMQGLLHVGETTHARRTHGRSRPPPASAGPWRGWASSWRRFKTGTPPRLDGRTIDYDQTELQPGDDAARAVLLPHRADRLPADALLDHLHHARGPRADPRQPAPGADVQRADPIDRAALLPFDRNQDRPLRRQAAAPVVPRAGGTADARGLRQRPLDQPAARRAGRHAAADPRPGAGRDRPLRLCHRVRLRPARCSCSSSLETKRVAGLYLRRPGQRHHRLRRGGRPGTAGRRQRRAGAAGQGAAGAAAATRPTSA